MEGLVVARSLKTSSKVDIVIIIIYHVAQHEEECKDDDDGSELHASEVDHQQNVGDGREDEEGGMEGGYVYWKADDSWDNKQTCMMKSNRISHQILAYNRIIGLRKQH